MSDDRSPLFSETQLSQIATMMPAIAQKSKLQSGIVIPISKETKNEETAVIESADLYLANEETKKGLSRLSDFLQKKKKSPPPEIKTEVRKLVPVDFVLVPSPQEIKRQGLQIYAWVERAALKTHLRGGHLNRYF